MNILIIYLWFEQKAFFGRKYGISIERFELVMFRYFKNCDKNKSIDPSTLY